MRSLSFNPILDPRVFLESFLVCLNFSEEKILSLLLFGKKETLDPFFLESLLDPSFPDTKELEDANSKSSQSKKIKVLIAFSSSWVSSVFFPINELRIKENTLIHKWLKIGILLEMKLLDVFLISKEWAEKLLFLKLDLLRKSIFLLELSKNKAFS